MERRVSVNDEMTSGRPEISPDGLPQGWREGDWPQDGAAGRPDEPAKPHVSGHRSPEQGPCLFLGPSGQRCGRRALAGGFCAKHQIDGAAGDDAGGGKNWTRVLAATGAIIALLWPYIEDLIHEIMRWTHPR